MRAASAFAKLSSNTVLATPGMALDLESLSLADPGNQASLASMPEELWRRIAAYLRPATTARAFVVASGRSSSLQKALRAEIEQTERALFGMTRDEAETRASSTTGRRTKYSSAFSPVVIGKKFWQESRNSRAASWLSTSRPGHFAPAVTSRPRTPRQTSRRVVSRHWRGGLC